MQPLIAFLGVDVEGVVEQAEELALGGVDDLDVDVGDLGPGLVGVRVVVEIVVGQNQCRDEESTRRQGLGGRVGNPLPEPFQVLECRQDDDRFHSRDPIHLG